MSKFNWKNVLVAGTAAGVISGLVKLGWENILPPRTPERNKTNPPQKLLEQMGVPAHLTHFGFSISFATAYAALLEKKVKWLTIDQGVPFGLGVWIAFHLVIMPLMKTVPSPKNQPMEEHISEALGHIAWMWTNNEIAEIVLQQLGQRKKEH